MPEILQPKFKAFYMVLPSSPNHFRFSNLGNTCYMNAILQSLFSLPSFSNDMLRQSIPWKKVPINALLRYYARLWRHCQI